MHPFAIRRAISTFAAMLVAVLAAACSETDPSAPAGAPTIASFSATPATVASGSQVQLSWSTSGATQLVIDNGVGDVSSSTSKTVTVTAGTTYTLTATNASGSATASTVVAVAAAAAPTLTTFTATPATLPATGGSVTLSWAVTGATTLTIDNGVGDVSALTSTVVNVAANTTFTLTATNAAGTVSQTAAVVLGTGTELFFDVVNGTNNPSCTQAAPCRSLSNALGGAAPGTTFTLADGVYSATTEGHPGLTIPDGATLRAVHPGAVTLASMQIVLPSGSATFDGIAIGPESPTASYCGSLGIGQNNTAVPLQTVTLNGVSSNCFNWLVITGNAKATMTPGALPGGLYTTGLSTVGSVPNGYQWLSVTAGAELVIQGGVIEGNNTGSPLNEAGVLHLPFGGKLTLDGVTVRNWAEPAIYDFAGNVTLTNGTVLDHVGDPNNTSGCAITASAQTSLTMDHATLSNVPGVGICVHLSNTAGEVPTIQLSQSAITNVTGAAIQQLNGGFCGSLASDGLSLVGNGFGIQWKGGQGCTFVLNNTTITGSTVTQAGGGIYLDLQLNPGSFKMRGSSVANNATDGILFSQFTNATVDLGTSADPGGNAFSGNGASGLHIDALGGPATVNAVGNTWAPSLQGADANGRYSAPPSYGPVPKFGPASGPNFTIDNTLSTLNL